MANEGIPVNKDGIAWARKRSGSSQQEATEKFAKIAAWEAGDAFPTYPPLEAMAEDSASLSPYSFSPSHRTCRRSGNPSAPCRIRNSSAFHTVFSICCGRRKLSD